MLSHHHLKGFYYVDHTRIIYWMLVTIERLQGQHRVYDNDERWTLTGRLNEYYLQQGIFNGGKMVK